MTGIGCDKLNFSVKYSKLSRLSLKHKNNMCTICVYLYLQFVPVKKSFTVVSKIRNRHNMKLNFGVMKFIPSYLEEITLKVC